MFCSKCGTENLEGAKFCSKCGAELGVAAAPSEGATKAEAETSVGMSPNVAGLLCYVLGWITGIVFVVPSQRSKFVKFHAWQSIMTFGVLSVVQIILSIITGIALATLSFGLAAAAHVLFVIVWVLIVGLWIALIITAGTGGRWNSCRVRIWAEKQASK